MPLNDPQPEEAKTGDFIWISNEDEPLKHLIGRSMRIGQINSGEKNERIYQLIDFNNKPVMLITLDGKSIEYWTKRDYFEIERRIVNGKDIFFQISKKKINTTVDTYSELEDDVIKVDILSSMIHAIFDWIKK